LTDPDRMLILMVLNTDSIGVGMGALPAPTAISDQALRWLRSQLVWERRLAELQAPRAVPVSGDELADRRDERATVPATGALPAAS
jgi:hypothetical protein